MVIAKIYINIRIIRYLYVCNIYVLKLICFIGNLEKMNFHKSIMISYMLIHVYYTYKDNIDLYIF